MDEDIEVQQHARAANPAVSRAPFAAPQQALHDALAEIDQQGGLEGIRLADIYRGVVVVLAQEDNPDHLAQAAHGARELIEKLPRVADVPTVHGSGLTVRVRDVCGHWRTYSILAVDAPDRAARRDAFDLSMEELVLWFEERDNSRRQAAGLLLDQLDQRKVKLPAPIRTVHVHEWDLYDRYFQGVSHHQIATTKDEFTGYLDAFEGFLLDRLRPRTYDDRAALKAIITEGETNAGS